MFRHPRSGETVCRGSQKAGHHGCRADGRRQRSDRLVCRRLCLVGLPERRTDARIVVASLHLGVGGGIWRIRDDVDRVAAAVWSADGGMEAWSMAMLFCLLVGVAMMLIGVPVIFSFTLIGLLMAYLLGIDLAALMPAAVRSIDSFTLLALPMFILLGALMRDADLSSRLIDFSKALVGHIRGGLGAVTILSCAVFGAISGSAAAAITSIGAFMIPELERNGYPKGYATGLVAASSLLSLLIPPSIPMIIFAKIGRAHV